MNIVLRPRGIFLEDKGSVMYECWFIRKQSTWGCPWQPAGSSVQTYSRGQSPVQLSHREVWLITLSLCGEDGLRAAGNPDWYYYPRLKWASAVCPAGSGAACVPAPHPESDVCDVSSHSNSTLPHPNTCPCSSEDYLVHFWEKWRVMCKKTDV